MTASAWMPVPTPQRLAERSSVHRTNTIYALQSIARGVFAKDGSTLAARFEGLFHCSGELLASPPLKWDESSSTFDSEVCLMALHTSGRSPPPIASSHPCTVSVEKRR